MDVFAHTASFLPIVAVGLAFRLLGICIVTLLSRSRRAPRRAVLEIAFCFLCTLPRATLQGALGGHPDREYFFASAGKQGAVARQVVADGAKLYIVSFSVLGSLVLEFFGPALLRATEDSLQVHAHKARVNTSNSNASCTAPLPSGSADLDEDSGSDGEVARHASEAGSSSASEDGLERFCQDGGAIYRAETM